MSIRISVGQATNGRNVKLKKNDFLVYYLILFFAKIRLIDAHLFYEFVPSVYKKRKFIYIETLVKIYLMNEHLL